jgi:NADH-quinone oxidoreductase subunit N
MNPSAPFTLPLTAADWAGVLPLLVLAVAGVAALLLDIVIPKKTRRVAAIGVGLAACVASAATAFNVWSSPLSSGASGAAASLSAHAPESIFGGAFITGGFTVVIWAIVLVATFLSLLLAYSLGREDQSAGAVALILWSATGAMLLAGAADLMVVFLGIELLSLALFALCALAPRSGAHEAALKYLILSSTASAFMLFGMTLLFGATGSVSLAALADAPSSSLFTVGLGLFGVGLCFKLSLAPFHQWAPDVYAGAPLPVTAFMSVVTKVGVFAVLARVIYGALPHPGSAKLLAPLWILAALSMIVGNVGALAQTDMKRLLAYSGIAQLGYVIAALAGVTDLGLRYATFYLAGYTFMNLGAFAVTAILSRKADEGSRLSSFNGLAQRSPWLAAAMTFFLLALTGLPPTVGFIGKLLLLWSTVDSTYVWLGVTLIAGSAISAYAYLKIVRAMFGRSTGRGIERGYVEVNPLPWFGVAVCTIAILVLGIYPRFPSDIIPHLK